MRKLIENNLKKLLTKRIEHDKVNKLSQGAGKAKGEAKNIDN